MNEGSRLVRCLLCVRAVMRAVGGPDSVCGEACVGRRQGACSLCCGRDVVDIAMEMGRGVLVSECG